MVISFDDNINNLNDLAKHLKSRILKKHGKEDLYFYIEEINDDYILGCINGARFMLYYEKRQRMTLEISQGFPKAKQMLLNVLDPLMWHIDEKAKNPEKFVRPILEYKINNESDIIEWETFDPMQKLINFAFEYYNGEYENIRDIIIHYPNVEMEELFNNIKYGTFTGGINPEYLEAVEDFTELELYVHIKGTLDSYKKIESEAQKNGDDVEEKLDMIAYLLCYLMQQTPKFEVKTNPPSNSPIEPTIEQLAWIRWWSEKINELAIKEPEKFKEWENFPLKIDPNYKPEGSYKDLIEEIKVDGLIF